MSESLKVPKQMEQIYDSIVTLTSNFCNENLNDEYSQLALEVSAALCRKRPSPLMKGNNNTWACGIIYALGFVNFLFDKSQTPYINAADLCAKFGVGKGTGAAYSRKVRDLLKMYQLDPKWCLPSKLGDNPMAWMIKYDGFIVDVRTLSREIQEIAYQKGLIPYIPEDKKF